MDTAEVGALFDSAAAALGVPATALAAALLASLLCGFVGTVVVLRRLVARIGEYRRISKAHVWVQLREGACANVIPVVELHAVCVAKWKVFLAAIDVAILVVDNDIGRMVDYNVKKHLHVIGMGFGDKRLQLSIGAQVRISMLFRVGM